MKIKGTLYFLLTIVIVLLNTCDEKERLNPWDLKNTLDPSDWAPQNLEIEVISITERKLSWQYGDHNIEGFKVDRKEGDGEWKQVYAKLGNEARSWNDTEIVPNESLTYSYRVYAYAGSNESRKTESSTETAFPKPTNLKITINSISSVSLSWQDNSTGEEGFKIDRKIGNDNWVVGYAPVSANETSYTDNDVNLVENRYLYRVYAYYGVYNSDYDESEYLPLEVTTNEITHITHSSATSGGYVVGSHVDSRGIAYGTSANPSITGSTVEAGSGEGNFTANITGLTPLTTYHVRAYATNSAGTAYGNNVTFKTLVPCGTNVTFMYKGQQVTYGTVLRGGLCWMDRNLGASRVPTSSTDTQGYGDLFQWGRLDDGHQNRTSGTTSTLSNTNVPGHGNFITVGSSPYDWRSPQNNNLWQGTNGINNPCPSGWRVPTEAELNDERQSWAQNNSAGAYASTLKWPVGGNRSLDGTLYVVGSHGDVWSSSVSGTDAGFLGFGSNYTGMFFLGRAHGMSVRCVRDL